MNTQQLNWKEFLFHTLKGQLLLAGLAIVAIYLITEHTAHVIQVLPYGLFLLCPISMMFMHGGNHDHADPHAGHSAQPGNSQANTLPGDAHAGHGDHAGHLAQPDDEQSINPENHVH